LEKIERQTEDVLQYSNLVKDYTKLYNQNEILYKENEILNRLSNKCIKDYEKCNEENKKLNLLYKFVLDKFEKCNEEKEECDALLMLNKIPKIPKTVDSVINRRYDPLLTVDTSVLNPQVDPSFSAPLSTGKVMSSEPLTSKRISASLGTSVPLPGTSAPLTFKSEIKRSL
jgi:uncharacterized protein YydD (DUF2326 family)